MTVFLVFGDDDGLVKALATRELAEEWVNLFPDEEFQIEEWEVIEDINDV